MEANVPRRQQLDPFALLEKFSNLKPPKFKGRPDLLEAEEWIQQNEKLIRAMQCLEDDKVRLGTFTLEKKIGGKQLRGS